MYAPTVRPPSPTIITQRDASNQRPVQIGGGESSGVTDAREVVILYEDLRVVSVFVTDVHASLGRRVRMIGKTVAHYHTSKVLLAVRATNQHIHLWFKNRITVSKH